MTSKSGHGQLLAAVAAPTYAIDEESIYYGTELVPGNRDSQT